MPHASEQNFIAKKKHIREKVGLLTVCEEQRRKTEPAGNQNRNYNHI